MNSFIEKIIILKDKKLWDKITDSNSTRTLEYLLPPEWMFMLHERRPNSIILFVRTEHFNRIFLNSILCDKVNFVLLCHDMSLKCWLWRFACLLLVFFRRRGQLGPVQHYVWWWSAVIGAFQSSYCFPVQCFPHAFTGLPGTAAFDGNNSRIKTRKSQQTTTIHNAVLHPVDPIAWRRLALSIWNVAINI